MCQSMRLLTVILGLLTISSAVFAQGIHTPLPGSPERQAVCDTLRTYVAANYTLKRLPKPIVFKIDSIRIQGDYCHFEGIPLFKDGSDAIGVYVYDIVLNICLERGGDGWMVVYDLSRTDVPSDQEMREIKEGFPSDFPTSLLSKFWRDKFNSVR